MSVQPQPVYGAQQPIYGAPVYGAQQPAFGAPVYGAQQPMVQPMGTQVIVQQPQGDTKMVCSKEGHRTWSSDIMDCFDNRTSCCFTWTCPWWTMTDISGKMGEHPCVPLCVPGGMVALRARLRTMGGIKGSVCGDCLTLYCCFLCGLGQMERELYHMSI